MVLIPAGTFLMGSSPKDGQVGFTVGVDELPQHSVDLKSYYIDRHEVTAKQYRKFIDSTGRKPPGDPRFPEIYPWAREGGVPIEFESHPVIYVSWDDADAYCKWAGKRLPIEAEWEKAARGADGRIWPWGNIFDPRKANVQEHQSGGTLPVGSFPKGASPYGVYDMAGNVKEWCANSDGEKRYILAPDGLKLGQAVLADESADILPGNALPLKAIPAGTMIHNVELRPGKGGQIARSAGSSVQLVAREGEYASVRMPSGEIRKINIACVATVGQVGNLDHENVSIGKAGRSRWLGKRPHVRGVVMNPVDHPHGGGEGRTSGGRHPVTPWGVPTKGHKTRRTKRTSSFIVERRKK